jgi:hypothetical protein
LEKNAVNTSPIKEFPRLFLTKIMPLIRKQVNFKVAIIEMYPRIPWELVADPLGSTEHSMGTTALERHSLLLTHPVHQIEENLKTFGLRTRYRPL